MIRRVLLSLIILFLLISSAPAEEKQDKLPENCVLFINIGDGDAILLRLNKKAYLIDTGRKHQAVRLYSALNFLNVDELEGLFITHSHKDHVGGIEALAHRLDIKNSYISSLGFSAKSGRLKTEDLLKKQGLSPVKLNFGDKISLSDDGRDYLDVIGPIKYDELDDNDNSLVLMLHFNGKRLLFTGDMQFSEEESLLNANVSLKADVLKVGNHGNKDATSKTFADAVSPKIAVISTDTSIDRNSANDKVIKNLSSAQIYVTENAELGYLLSLDEEELEIEKIDLPIKEKNEVELHFEGELVVVKALSDVNYQKPMLYFREKGEIVKLNELRLKSGESLSIGKGGDFELDIKKRFIKKRIDELVLFDEFGNVLASLIKKPNK